MRVIGIDQSLRATGVFWTDRETHGFKQIEPGGRRDAERLLFIQHEIRTILDVVKPALVCMEGYAFAAPGRVFQLGELGGVIKVTLCERNIPVIVATPTQVKLFATGHGGAEKITVVNAMNTRFGFEWVEKDNNLADAAALCCIAEAYLIPSSVSTRAQAEVISTLKNGTPAKKKKTRLKRLHSI